MKNEPKEARMLYFAEAGKYYRTRSGCRAFVANEMGGNPFRDQIDSYPLLGYVEGIARICSWSIDGRVRKGLDGPLDLIKEIPKPDPIVGWVNIYPSAEGAGSAITSGIYPTKCAADAVAVEERMACIRIEALAGDGLNRDLISDDVS